MTCYAHVMRWNKWMTGFVVCVMVTWTQTLHYTTLFQQLIWYSEWLLNKSLMSSIYNLDILDKGMALIDKGNWKREKWNCRPRGPFCHVSSLLLLFLHYLIDSFISHHCLTAVLLSSVLLIHDKGYSEISVLRVTITNHNCQQDLNSVAQFRIWSCL